jgi:hypothetical protein
MAHFALHFPVVNKNTDSSLRFELRELNELPFRLVFMIHPKFVSQSQKSIVVLTALFAHHTRVNI